MTSVASLLSKYDTILRLRVEHEAAITRGERPPPPLPALRQLSREFPGSLAELERLPTKEIQARVDELRAGAWPMWARAWAAVHDGLLGALAAKRWLRGRRVVGSDERDALGAAVDRGEVHAAARAWIARLDAIAMPPGGRLVGLVHAEVANALGVTADAMDALLFKPSRT